MNKYIKTINWFLLKKDKKGEILESNFIKENGNIIRILSSIIIPCVFIYFPNFITQLFLNKLFIPFRIIALFIFLRIYWEWIKIIWLFIQKDKIIKYLFLLFIPFLIYIIGFNSWFNGGDNAISDINKLSSFYSTLFTAIAVLVGIAGLSAWRTINNIKETEKKVNELYDLVENLDKENKLSLWIKNKFETSHNDSSKSNLILEFNEKDYKQLDELKDVLNKKWSREAYLKILFAQDGLSHKEDKYYYLSFLKTERIYNSLLVDTSLKTDYNSKAILELLYHEIGLLYWKWYKSIKKDYLYNNSICNDASCDEVKNSIKALNKTFFNSRFANTFTEKRTPFDLLFLSIKFYLQSENILQELSNTKKETYGNIVLPMIELLKYYDFLDSKEYIVSNKNSESKDLISYILLESKESTTKHEYFIKQNNADIYLFQNWNSSEESLKKNIKKSFDKLKHSRNYNITWDTLRFKYYTENKALSKKDFDDIISNINTINDKIFFLEMLNEELQENPPCISDKNGFPNDNKYIEYCKKELNNKKLI